MKFKIIVAFFFSAILLLLTSLSVKGQDIYGTSSNRGQDKKQDVMEKIGMKKDEIKERIALNKEDLLEKLEMKRKEASESHKLKREALRLRLQSIKDERRRLLTEKISTKAAEINTRRTNRWMEILNKLSAILQRLIDKVNAAKSQGKDTAAAEAAIATAEAKIALAEDAVASQAGKVYVANVTTDATLNNNVGSLISGLQSDLQAVHRLIIEAKQAVMNVVREMARAHIVPLKVGQPGSLTPTSSATASPSLTATPSATVAPTATSTPTATPTP